MLIYFFNRLVIIELWDKNELISKRETDNASKYLIVEIANILSNNALTLKQLGGIFFLSAPSPFTTNRIVESTCLGIERGSKIKTSPLKLEDVIYSFTEYKEKNIIIQLTNNLWQIFTKDSWEIINELPESANFILYNEDFTKINVGMLRLIDNLIISISTQD